VTREEARRRFTEARVATLATADADGRPHVVPMVFAVAGDVVYGAVDSKPKRTTSLRRLANLQANPRVALLVHEYDDADWSRLWWVRADGDGRVLEPGEGEAREAVASLVERYSQYRDDPPSGPVIAIDVFRWSGWAFSGASGG
jgi:PPOX class probable F420-dependent enzyme